MNIALLEANFTLLGVPFVHMAPTSAAAHAARMRFFSACAASGEEFTVAADYRFMTCTLAGGSCEHVPVLILEDEADMDPAALREALLIPAPIDGHQPMVIRVGRTLAAAPAPANFSRQNPETD